ncbi:hypothetical protein K502DRAFT_293042 [Neoconidiobolus thromboides FSU 785]|nr:hypothetical protein K502DRAFT_293042 [Neoconidiobolus thromboides FSU 785]
MKSLSFQQTKNEDPFYTTRKHKYAFYLHTLGFLPYALTAVHVIPSLLDSLITENGYLADGLTQCNGKDICYLKINTLMIPNTSAVLYINGITTIFQALFLILFSGLADHGNYRSYFLLVFTILGSISSSIIALINSSNYVVLIILCMLANVSTVIASAFFLSYISFFANFDQRVMECNSDKEVKKIKDSITTELSANPFSLAMLLTFGISLTSSLISLNNNNSIFSLQLGVSLPGLFWLILGLISYIYLPKYKFPSIPNDQNIFTYSIIEIYKIIINFKQYKDIWLGLVSWFFLSDGLSTGISTAIFVGRRELAITSSDTLLINAIGPLVEGVAVTILYFLKKWFPKQLNILNLTNYLSLFSLIFPIWGLFGLYLSVGIKSKVEYYIYYLFLFSIYATIQCYHRALYSQMLPKSKDAMFFAIYLISYKGTSWIGSISLGAIVNTTNQIRLGYYLVFGLLAAGVICLFFIKLERATRVHNLILQTE